MLKDGTITVQEAVEFILQLLMIPQVHKQLLWDKHGVIIDNL